MKKKLFVLLLVLLPSVIFSEVVFVPRIGMDVHKGIKSDMLDKYLVDFINKALQSGKDPNEEVTTVTTEDIPHSKPLITMFTAGLDMQFIAHGNGFTFFWNNEFSIAQRFMAFEKFYFEKKLTNLDKDKVIKETDKYYQDQKVMLVSTELLFGGTFRRESAFNINFGLGIKASVTPSTIVLVKGLFNQQFPENDTVIAVIPAVGGTFGVAYYFNEWLGLSISVSDYVGFGAFVAGNVKQENGGIKAATAFASIGLNNNFSCKFGLNLRVNGVRN